MDGKGWRPEYGISAEGIEILGFVEALPREGRQGYLSLHDDVRARLMRERARQSDEMAKVIPLFRRG